MRDAFRPAALRGAFALRLPIPLRSAAAIPIGLGLAFSAALVVGEGDRTSLPFAFACFFVLAGLAFLITRRPGFAVFCGVALMSASAAVSMAKYRYMGVNAHVIDLAFYFGRPDTILYLAHEFLWPILAVAALAAGAVFAGVFVYRRDEPWPVPRLAVAEVWAASLVFAVLALPAEADSIAYHIRKNHFFSSFFASLSDVARIGRDSALKARLAAEPAPPAFAAESCPAGGPRPDIVAVLSESAVPPSRFPAWRYDPAILAGFHSFDGRIHPLRVETYAGGTWISEVEFMTGLSPADLDWRRSYATLFLENRVRHSLPQHLKACGYHTVAISPLTEHFVNEGPFLRSIGIDEFLDYRAIGAASKHEPDSVYYRAAREAIARHRRASDAPLFVFVLTMSGHSPYDYRFAPAETVAGEPFGNGPETDEYLRRLSLARRDLRAFLSGLEPAPDGRGLVAVEFGDHQPIVTQPIIEAAEGRGALGRFTSAAYLTHYSVATIGRPPAAPLPEVPVLDLSYLGLTVLEVAGLPLGPAYEAQRRLRDTCAGTLHTCADRAAVDHYLGRLMVSGLVDFP